jgi:hypothetical protein
MDYDSTLSHYHFEELAYLQSEDSSEERVNFVVRIYKSRFASLTLPLLAKHYQREALSELQTQFERIGAFASFQPDFAAIREKFFDNGIDYIDTLESFTGLLRLAEGNDYSTYDSYHEGVQYLKFVSILCDVSESPSGEKSRDVDDYEIGQVALLRQERAHTEEGSIRRSFFEEAINAVRRYKLSKKREAIYIIFQNVYTRVAIRPIATCRHHYWTSPSFGVALVMDNIVSPQMVR